MSEELEQFIFLTLLFIMLGGLTWYFDKFGKQGRKERKSLTKEDCI